MTLGLFSSLGVLHECLCLFAYDTGTDSAAAPASQAPAVKSGGWGDDNADTGGGVEGTSSLCGVVDSIYLFVAWRVPTGLTGWFCGVQIHLLFECCSRRC